MGYDYTIDATITFPAASGTSDDPVEKALQLLAAADLMHPMAVGEDLLEALESGLSDEFFGNTAEAVRDSDGGVTITLSGQWKFSAFQEVLDVLAAAGASGHYDYAGEDGTDSGTGQFGGAGDHNHLAEDARENA